MDWKTCDVIVLGAGAAGMMAAATAGLRGRRVVLIDHADKLAEKIRISGGGRCNFTNLNVRPECYLSQNPHFCKSALRQYTQHDFIQLVESYGLTWHEKTLGQLFCDQHSGAIIEMLKAECDRGGVTWRMSTKITEVRRGEQFEVITPEENWRAEALIVATGGLSIPQIGATGIGYDIARQFGLDIVETVPALVPLQLPPESLLAEISGVALEDTVARMGKTAFREASLVTHRGLSGPAILQISSFWQPGGEIVLDLAPDVDLDEFFASANRDAHVGNVLVELLPRRFIDAWLAPDITAKPLKQLSPKQVQQLAERMHRWPLRPSGSAGYKKAEVTKGGVDTQALDSKTMMAKAAPGLYFIGEVVDVTGWLGGYNFQWAWSSGFVSGSNA
ncbi:NAD(P)/FAD-dependent oxidoreductase [Andreprevotia chitinilytica]|uniref:NAD(P)/FAD-dependent oxidoreductase n=1 Tax=Andreprevotia chitinilytica TaxID=396808 RepID=UPI00055032EA|nr:NAD(P)/FAD-dependent oxidoreductase [Andreprevotia chitinilytica]